MLKYSNFAIVASFFGLWVDSFLSQDSQIYVGFLLIFSFGILHGANDLTLIKNINSTQQLVSYWKILLYYISVVLVGAILFYILPALALLLFIIVSGYHFGEQHWNTKINLGHAVAKISYQLSYGMVVLFMLFIFHLPEVERIIYDITAVAVPGIGIKTAFVVLLSSMLILGLILHSSYKAFKEVPVVELFYLVVFAVLFKVSSLIWGFALYFIFWHSIPSIQDQLVFLYGSSSLKNFGTYFKSALLYWLISLIGIAVLYYMFKDLKLFNALFFSFLASITFPHVLVIEKMFRNKNNT